MPLSDDEDFVPPKPAKRGRFATPATSVDLGRVLLKLPCIHSIKCVLLMARLTMYMGIVHIGGAFEVSTTRIQDALYT